MKPLCSSHEWIDRALTLFRGNLLACRLEVKGQTPLTVVSVYSPAWSISRERLAESDVSELSTKCTGELWCSDILWAGLREVIDVSKTWVVGGDFNSSETFDVERNLADARAKIGCWREEYNSERPHSSLSYRTPNEFAETMRSSILHG